MRGKGVHNRLLRYAELHPEILTRRFADGAPAVLPLGALEWHGPHLPLGLDLLVAEAFAERLAERLDGVLLPALVTPVTTLPHPLSLQVPTEAFRGVMDATLNGLVTAGVQTLIVVSGHYAQGHEIEMYEAAMRAMEDFPDVRVFAAAPLEPVADEALLDHAGRVEASLLLAIRPDLVRLDAADGTGVLGEDPRAATAADGEALIERGLDAWIEWMHSDRTSLGRWYGGRFDAYEPYVDAYYRGSWEDAIKAWWAERQSVGTSHPAENEPE